MEALEKILNAWFVGPVWVSILFFLGLFVYRKDKKMLQNRMDNIESHLTNHVTGTEKQIAQLRTDMNAKFDKIDSKFDKTDAKIDQLKTDMYTKIDSNFNNILTVLNSLSKKNESDSKRNTE